MLFLFADLLVNVKSKLSFCESCTGLLYGSQFVTQDFLEFGNSGFRILTGKHRERVYSTVGGTAWLS